ncbi:hypothetical protein KP509_14G054800 [Ceratopteris richardii]|uniref:t-SNARE coiled-coil homology domain-containing protein n=1 Tax=Ceratopteris richardii TaxID=49495 RepID=A0A8T2TBV0_CERRI|nr:hypothetical protein KP509_14G054800 [Ceratopteris richardii]
MMNGRRDPRGARASLFDGLEEGITRASASYSSLEISELDNENSIDGLQDRVGILKKLTTDIHGEVEAQNRMLDRMGVDMDSSRGMLLRTVDRFKNVFESKSGRSMLTLVGSFVALFLLVYFLTR